MHRVTHREYGETAWQTLRIWATSFIIQIVCLLADSRAMHFKRVNH